MERPLARSTPNAKVLRKSRSSDDMLRDLGPLTTSLSIKIDAKAKTRPKSPGGKSLRVLRPKSPVDPKRSSLQSDNVSKTLRPKSSKSKEKSSTESSKESSKEESSKSESSKEESLKDDKKKKKKHKKKPHLTYNGYERYEIIGKGGYAKVYRGLNVETQQEVAIKILDLNKHSDINDLRQEILVLSQCNHPNIMKYYGSFLKYTKLWILMEYLGGGSVSDVLLSGPIDELQTAVIRKSSLEGLHYLHQQGHMHRDIKAGNIMFNEEGQIKLGDFGLAIHVSDEKTKTFNGTPYWIAPEVILHNERYDYKADIWALGITAIQIATGKIPYEDIHPVRALLYIPQNPAPTLVGNFSKTFKEFVSLCLTKDPTKRSSTKQLLKHKFITKAGDFGLLVSLVARHQRWKEIHSKDEYTSSASSSDEELVNWDFTAQHQKENA